MGKFVTPKVYLIGYTGIDIVSLGRYLKDTENLDFQDDIWQAGTDGVKEGELLCSFFAKLCYKSLTVGKNKNITQTRSILENLKSIIATGHGSVLEHCSFNFVIHNCSRILTHEIVRHRVGTAFSQTSGRYVAIDEIDLVLDPILDPFRLEISEEIKRQEVFLKDLREKLIKDGDNFDQKKKKTSAIRRLAPNGQANDIGITLNIRSLRHIIELRTNRGAEWEIREVVNQMANLIVDKFPTSLHGGTKELVDGLAEWKGLSV